MVTLRQVVSLKKQREKRVVNDNAFDENAENVSKADQTLFDPAASLSWHLRPDALGVLQ